ncbi:MAG: hypothetical protein HY653_06545, partial [Acidobacteria bacterium]|nr:hypothetical protein [Acidobacteriota bacterium]
TLDLRLPLSLATSRRHLAVPKEGVRVQGAGLKEIIQTQAPQVRVYAIETRGPGELKLHLEVDPAALAAAPEPETPAASEGESTVTIVPHPVNRAQWYIVGLSLFVLLLGLYYLSSLESVPGATHEPTPEPRRSTP